MAIFQRGAADGLNIVIPFFEKRYYQLRPSIAIATPGTSNNQNTAIDLDGRFALHPQLQPLKALWDSRQLAIVDATGSPDPTRSHFDAQEFMECGTPGVKAEDGWLNRALPLVSTNASPMRAIAMGTQVPKALRGSRGAVAVDDLPKFQIGNPQSAAILESLYSSAGDAKLQAQGKGTFEAVRMIESIRQRPYTPANGAQYVGRVRPAAAAGGAPDQGRRGSRGGVRRHRRMGSPWQRERSAVEPAPRVRHVAGRVLRATWATGWRTSWW